MKGLVWRAILRLYIVIFWLFNGLPLHQSAIIRPKMPLYASQSWILQKKHGSKHYKVVPSQLQVGDHPGLQVIEPRGVPGSH